MSLIFENMIVEQPTAPKFSNSEVNDSENKKDRFPAKDLIAALENRLKKITDKQFSVEKLGRNNIIVVKQNDKPIYVVGWGLNAEKNGEKMNESFNAGVAVSLTGENLGNDYKKVIKLYLQIRQYSDDTYSVHGTEEIGDLLSKTDKKENDGWSVKTMTDENNNLIERQNIEAITELIIDKIKALKGEENAESK